MQRGKWIFWQVCIQHFLFKVVNLLSALNPVSEETYQNSLTMQLPTTGYFSKSRAPSLVIWAESSQLAIHGPRRRPWKTPKFRPVSVHINIVKKYSLGINCENSQWEDMKFLNTFVSNFSPGAKCRLFILGKYEIFFRAAPFRPFVFMSHAWHCKYTSVTR